MQNKPAERTSSLSSLLRDSFHNAYDSQSLFEQQHVISCGVVDRLEKLRNAFSALPKSSSSILRLPLSRERIGESGVEGRELVGVRSI